MTKRLLIPALALGTLLFVWGCDSFWPNVPAPNTQVLVPLEIGNEWAWRTTVTRAVSGEPLGQARIDTVAVLADTVVAGEKWFKLRSDAGDYYATNRLTGFWIAPPPSIGPFDPALQYRYPVTPGERFVLPSPSGGTVVHVLATDTSVTVPAGTFKTVLYFQELEVAGRTYRCEFYLSPGVGLVKQVMPMADAKTGELFAVRMKELMRYSAR